MILLGITGPIGHGKSTFAKALTELEPSTKHFESSMIVGEVVNALHEKTQNIPDRDDLESINAWLRALPEILASVVHQNIDFDQVQISSQEVEQHPVEYSKLFLHLDNLRRDPGLLKQKVTRQNKESYRPFLQWLGGYLVKEVDPGIWYKEIVRRIEKAKEEGSKLCLVGGLRFPHDAALLREAGGKIVKVYRPGHLQYDMLDPTERERDDITVDTTVASNGTVEDLNICAKKFLDDAWAGKLESMYQTTKFADKK